MSTNNNNTAETMARGSAFQESVREEDTYPDPNTLPLPSQEQRIADVTLSELIPGKYVSTTARVVYLRAIEKQDALGSKMIFSGILEDSAFKVPFISHRISYPLIRNCVYKFQSAYVHEFLLEKSLLLVITEYTKISPKDVEDYREYIWKPTVDSIRRPVKSVALQGVITTVHGNSGLIKRCNKCKSILYDDACPNKCPKEEGWGWDLRVSCKLYDGSGSIHNLTRFFKDSTARKKMETANILKQTVGMICKACGKNKVALVCTADSNTTSKGLIPRPTGGLYLKHAANVIVHIKEQSGISTIPSFKATLLKHQYVKTPKSSVIYIKKTGGMMLLD